MLRRWRVRAAVTVAASLLYCSLLLGGPSRADDDDDPHVMLFSGRDIWRNGAFAYAGLVLAPGGFEQNGLLLKIISSAGRYYYYSGSLAADVKGREWQTAALPGFRIKRGNAEFKVFFGPELQWHGLSPDDPASRLRGWDFGIRFAGELWCEPTPTTLIAGDAALASIGGSRSARLAFGWRVAQDLFENGFYAGPELQRVGADDYRQLRIGLHLTSMKTEATEWSAAAGWASDSDRRSGPYLRLNLSAKL